MQLFRSCWTFLLIVVWYSWLLFKRRFLWYSYKEEKNLCVNEKEKVFQTWKKFRSIHIKVICSTQCRDSVLKNCDVFGGGRLDFSSYTCHETSISMIRILMILTSKRKKNNDGILHSLCCRRLDKGYKIHFATWVASNDIIHWVCRPWMTGVTQDRFI